MRLPPTNRMFRVTPNPELGAACRSVGPVLFSMTKEEFCGAVKHYEPVSFAMVKAFGPSATLLFAHLLNVGTMHADADGWFFSSQKQITDALGMQRRQTEAAIEVLYNAAILDVATKPKDQRRYFSIAVTGEQLAQKIDDALASAVADEEMITRTPKTPPRAKQTANTAKESPDLSEQRREMVTPAPEPFGKTEQLTKEQKPKKPKADPAEIEAAAVRLIEHLNAVAGTAFRTTGKVNIEKFARVLKAKEGTEEEIRMVIELKTMQWGGKTEMKSHLNPETLTRPKNFPRYLEECYNAKNQINTPRPAAAGFAAQDNNRYMPSSEQKKMDMILAQIAAHPGIDKHIPQQLFFPQYLASISEHEVQNQLRNARNQWTPPNFFSKTDELPF